ncbi:MAG: DUF4190 domain-containing protein [Bacteroidetes bacterium]|nr:DUF4190 domain-containing protein [Bacteroidota bacterium]
MKKIIFLTLLFATVSCSVQKRRYQNGFYVSWKHSKQEHKTAKQHSEKNERAKSEQSFVLNEETISVSANEQISVLVSKEKRFLLDEECDEIVFKDGKETKVKLIEINSSEVRYKRCDMPNGPLYVAKKSEIFMVKYANGTREIFKNEPEVSDNGKKQSYQPIYVQQKKVPATATIALVFGILGIYPLTVIGSIVAVVCGAVALRQIKRNPDKYEGAGRAMAGLIMGIIVLALVALAIIVLLSLFI